VVLKFAFTPTNQSFCIYKKCCDIAFISVFLSKQRSRPIPVLSSSEIIKVPSLADWSNCEKKEFLLLQDDGTWYCALLNKALAEVNLYGEYTANCRMDGQAVFPATAMRK
jgi:hypothetical protein